MVVVFAETQLVLYSGEYIMILRCDELSNSDDFRGRPKAR
jgi:hypothetical protein